MYLNQPLLAAIVAWLMAQFLKLPLEFWHSGEWRFEILFSSGGMPSSHSALVAGLAWGFGLHNGFATNEFAVAVVLAMIVIYDATGIRRAAGEQARVINRLLRELAAGHPPKEQELRELLGHTPLQVLAGTLLGMFVAWGLWSGFVQRLL